MKARILLMCTIVLMFFVGLNADPISNEVFVGGGDYTTIQGAVDSIAANGIFNDINVIITNAYEPVNETFPITIGSDFNTSEFIVTFKVNDEITIECNEEAAMIVFDGCKNVVFDGGTDDENSRMLTFINPNIRGRVFEFKNGAQNIVLRYLNILGSGLSTNKGIIYFAESVGDQGNNDNIIEYCNISKVYGATSMNSPGTWIRSNGTETRPNENNTIRHNLFSGLKSIVTDHLAGLYLEDYNNNWQIDQNRFYCENEILLNRNFAFILIENNSNNNTISNNIIGGSNENNTGVCKLNYRNINALEFNAIMVKTALNKHNTIIGNSIKNIEIAKSKEKPISAFMISIESNCLVKDNNISDIYVTQLKRSAAHDYIGGIRLEIDFNADMEGLVTVDNNSIYNFIADIDLTELACRLNFCGIYNNWREKAIIKNNKIRDISFVPNDKLDIKIYGIFQDCSNRGTENSLVYNNMISLKCINSDSFYGIYHGRMKAKYYFNTNHLFSDEPVSNDSYCYYSKGDNLSYVGILNNNIFSNTVQGSGNHYAVYINDNYQNHELDYNIYNAQALGYINGGGDLDNVLGLGEDGHSKILAVDFLSDNDLHLNLASVNDGFFGVPIEGIETDIDGDVRNPDNPIIGADEVIYSPTLPVTLSAFYADASSTNNVLLKWVAETETSLLGYKVLRSADNSVVNARYVSSLIPAKNQSTQVEYSFTDNDLYNQRYYYWLE
ncbi:MAG: hypothetical protein RBS16_07800, partial [Candidatus Cloacimonadales bacterium]|nr:hypothetical protein [Candidatus Cloacimonadales bacterium]